MGNARKLPFKVRDQVESRSFLGGYRGAWFRSEIKQIRKEGGVISYKLGFLDFPDEKHEWTAAYQYNPGIKGKRKQLMVRPAYPPIYHEEQVPDVNANSEVAVIVDNSWKVGDLVDLLHSDCYWTGTITKKYNADEGEVVLLPPPVGEGDPYHALFKDVRPPLDWSPKFGWKLHTRGNGPACSGARLIKLSNKVPRTLQTMVTRNASDKTEANPVASSDNAKNKRSKDAVRPSLGTPVTKEFKDARGERVKCQNADTLEASVLELEECLNRVKWLQKILKHGISSPNSPTAEWKFLEPGATAQP